MRKLQDEIKTTNKSILKILKDWLEVDPTCVIGLTTDQIKELPLKVRRAIESYRIKIVEKYNKEGKIIFRNNIIEVKFVSKEKAIDMINKHIGFYEVDNKQKGNSINLENLSTQELLNRAKFIKEITDSE